MSTSTALAGGPTVPDRLELEDAVLIGEGVELGVEAVEHVRHFGGAHLGADLCETHDVGEVDRHHVFLLRLHLFPLCRQRRSMARQDHIRTFIQVYGSRSAVDCNPHAQQEMTLP